MITLGKPLLILVTLSLLWLGCTDSTKTAKESISLNDAGEPLLFEVIADSITTITFNNKVAENVVMNGFNYEYLYNGAGVSVADVNNDGLPDIYFAASLTDNELYLNKGNLVFENITRKSGVKGGYGLHQGTTMVDINMDGKMDLYICKSGIFDDPDKRRNELYVNQGNDASGIPIFKEESQKYGLDLPHYSTQAAFFDYDRDGDLDMFLLNHNVYARRVQENMEELRFKKSELTSDRLFRNDNGKYTDVSDESGMIDNGIGFGLGIAIGDLNNDGWADMVVGHDYTERDRLYLNQRDGTFKEVMNQSTGHISTFSMGNDIADFNNDGWLDFITVDMVSEDNYGIKASMSGMNPEQFNFLVDQGFHHQYMYNTLQLNNGIYGRKDIPVFSDMASFTGITSTDWSWGPLFFDMDNDGDKDLFVSNGIKRDFRNVDYILYKDKKEKELQQHLAEASDALKELMTKQFITDILRNMPARKKTNYFYENKGDLSFEKKNGSWAMDALTVSNGAAYADLDNDGDLDIITNNMDENAFIYRNNSAELGLGHYLKIKLNGPRQNKDGIGARVTLTTSKGVQISEQYLSRGFQSSVDNILHFGLDNEKETIEVGVRWPDGREQTLNPSEINRTLVLNYSDAEIPMPNNDFKKQLFKDITDSVGLKHIALENSFDDFKRESLLPHKMSQEGPALAVGDFDNDGLDDFYIGGAKGHAGTLYRQDPSGTFKPDGQTAFQNDKLCEDTGAAFFDMDGDGDLDLYVASGSNEYEPGSRYYTDRVYVNENGSFKKVGNPFDKDISVSSSVVSPYDYDSDGDQDLFVGGRQLPGNYPHSGTSILLRNDSEKGKIQFANIEEVALENMGMVTDAVWGDMDGDGIADLTIVGEWMPVKILKNHKVAFSDISEPAGLNKETGWWFSVEAADFDQDGDLDLVAGNLGLNSKYKASRTEPFQIYAKDFDRSGSLDIVLGYHQQGEQFPLRGRECSSNQMPFIKEKFPSYHDFASANLEEVYGKENLETALHYKVGNFATTYFENLGNGQFKSVALPNLAQQTAVRKILSKDIDKDGNLDLLLLGNLYGFEVETPRQDAGYGLVLMGKKGNNGFVPKMPYESGLYIKGDVSGASTISLAGGKIAILIGRNNDSVILIEVN